MGHEKEDKYCSQIDSAVNEKYQQNVGFQIPSENYDLDMLRETERDRERQREQKTWYYLEGFFKNISLYYIHY